MKNKIIVLALLISTLSYCQHGKTGFVAGVSNYSTKTDLLSSKSGIGYYLGIINTLDFNEKSELQVEIGVSKNFVTFLGRDDELGEPKEAKFSMTNPIVNAFYNYSFFENDNFKLGINAGPSVSILYEYKPVDDISDEFRIDPLLVEPFYLEFDTRNEVISINVFAQLGLSAYYMDSFVFNLRYFHGITDPYRNAPIVSVIDINGKDSYFLFSIGYLL
ncbi:outer membrane beta-barrel protein [uncultured Maribacter sp.]|uniref:outer membrane beta-barrel protein n=1 Tax=uncultured Maribacter sp. TaxID=431308 RepID=UPI002618EAF9|nr:outer membrane beta-barrel protein [uncultured Maribacter sp.]